MAQASASLHESPEQLSPELIDRHRAIMSLMEEFEAIDWYDQRVSACQDAELRAVLAHNRDEEKEHAVMTLEWLRRHDPVLDANLRKYLFRDGPIAGREHESAADAGTADGSLRLGSLRSTVRT